MTQSDNIFKAISGKRIAVFAALVIACAGIIAAAWVLSLNLPTGDADGASKDIFIETGMSAGEIGDLLHASELIRSPRAFRLYSRMTGLSRYFKAGNHRVPNGTSMTAIARLLTEMPLAPPDIRVTIIEGLSIRETAALLAKQAGIDSAAFVGCAEDSSFAHTLGVDKQSLEGYLYPNTYFIRPGTKPKAMIRRMTAQFRKVFDDSLKKRAAELNMTVSDVVTLASIIECEVTADDERPVVSSVFHRRLARNLPLGANPTIQYALGDKRRILNDDLTIDSPYNTYTHTGLPPGPIASPGLKSILAALYPAETKYLYFVADGNGRHVFSRTLAEHTAAVRKYRIAKKKAQRSK